MPPLRARLWQQPKVEKLRHSIEGLTSAFDVDGSGDISLPEFQKMFRVVKNKAAQSATHG